MNTTESDLRQQWHNPHDILSLLLLLGGDIVQKAIAQLVGQQVRPFGRHGPSLSVAPVAFSFGWVAYSFSNLLAVFGDMTLMPACDHSCILVNCANGFPRENRSWAMGRLLRDHEIQHKLDPRPVYQGGRAESLRIDVFELLTVSSPTRDRVWWLGWITLLVQSAISIVPWALDGDWTIALITFCGNFLALVTCALPPWTQEKWFGRQLQRGKSKTTCLTRGNGSHHIMVIIASHEAWDFEALAEGPSFILPHMRAAVLLLSVLWTCLLITVSGIKYNTWYLVCIGGIGMIQNLFAAGTPRNPMASNFRLRKSTRVPTIIGRREDYEKTANAQVDLKETENGLSEAALWASEVSRIQTPSEIGGNGQRHRLMPAWLETMSKDDGVPDWLEPIPPPAADADGSASGSVISKFFSRSSNAGLRTESGQETTVYAPGAVHGALIELEKWVPTAGLAMLEVFFPRGLSYNPETIRDDVHKRFWMQAHHVKEPRRKAEDERRKRYMA